MPITLAVLDSAKNYFEIFDLPISFSVDPKLVADRYRALVRGGHAEPLVSTDDETIVCNGHSSIRVEDAYRTLMDPLARAEYLLSLYPVGVGTAASGEQACGNGGAFLMEQMELRETLAEATNRSDPAAAVAEVLTQLAEQSAALDKELQSLFANPCPSNLRAAREIVRQLQFLGSCRRDAEERGAELGVRGVRLSR